MTLHPTTLDEIDYWDLDMFSEGNPHQAWRVQREEAPIWWHDRKGGEPFWSVTRYGDAHAVHLAPAVFSSQRRGIVVRSAEILAMGYEGATPGGYDSMIHTDPPRHAPLRKTISHNFTPRAIARLEERVREQARRCIRDAAGQRDIDFVTAIAHRIPSAIALSLLGVPQENWDRLAELEHATVAASDPEFSHGEDPAVAAATASVELMTYFGELIAMRRQSPGDDLISQLLAAFLDGERLPDEQVLAEAGLLLAGGLDTTRAAASAGGMLPLLNDAEQFEALWSDPSLVTTAVEEFVRYASPVVSEARTVTRDTELSGVWMREGERVVLWTGAVNRDPAVFSEPECFDIRRTPNRHLGFAFGEHYCLGVHLARLTLRVEFEELIRQFRKIEQMGEAKPVRSNFVGGLKHLPIRVTPR